MRASHHGLVSPPITACYTLGNSGSQSSDSDSDSSSSSASQTSLDVWDVVCEPSSQQSNYTSYSSESDYCGESNHASQQQKTGSRRHLFGESRLAFPHQLQTQYQSSSSQARETVPAELRKNPRRTSAACSALRGHPPALSRQVDRKVEFVDKLVDSATYIVEAIWPTSSVPCRVDFGTSNSVLPLRKFIEETLRRSRTSYSTLQVGLYYLILIKPHVPAQDFTMEQTSDSHAGRALQCGRRMFLAALILASKWLQDRNYSARAWSKISGLQISEINDNERAFLAAVNWNLHVGEDLYKVWSDLVMEHTPWMPPSPGAGARCFERECASFKKLIQGLTPKLDNVDDLLPAMKKQTFESTVPSTLFVPTPRYYTMPDLGSVHHSMALAARGYQRPTVPALGLLPTPRSTPRPLDSLSNFGFSTPAASAASQLLGRGQSMSSAVSYANTIPSSQPSDRWMAPAPAPSFTTCRTTSPQSYVPTRRSSLATSVSTASSPESMVSDSSSQSRTSSVSSSSASLMHNAPAYMQARRASGERQRMVYGQQYQLGQNSSDTGLGSKRKMAVADIIDPSPVLVRTSSPDSYNTYPSASCGTDQPYQLSVRDAAYALQELHNHRDETTPRASAIQAPKRKRTDGSALQENVRGLLDAECATMWTDEMVNVPVSPAKRTRMSTTGLYQPHLGEGAYSGFSPFTALPLSAASAA